VSLEVIKLGEKIETGIYSSGLASAWKTIVKYSK
jgi:hypothetical protein